MILTKLLYFLVKWTTICIIITLVGQEGLGINQMDVKTMCLDHDLHEKVYMAQQLGFYGCKKKDDL